ncbi:DNA repair protein RecN [Ornithinimicrobium sp. CNJ-824]|uniref:DNA repair protein RecN n=1 Tax=Ornithinimicrobium sp. CNJ-824 TaxID=1904966 RepID=UPI00096034DB|nr:DNA repair protein RecN [Ornithinimicrobium sp. CNJ-824]OLT19786.1 DNA repair protein RecN [Ornithinimicrobium sp. CNJ-824]
MTLRRIRIQGLGVIDEAELDLSPGLNVITGETGAGKTMVVSGLGLLLGARGDAGLVRSGTAQAVVEGEVDVPADHPAARRVTEAGGDASDGVLLVRTVASGGRSRAYVGGRSAPVAVLGEVGQHLVAVHGQADQWRLRDAEQHRILLDTAGGPELAAALGAYEQAFDAWQAARRRLVEVVRGAAERSLRVDVLRAALTEIDGLDPQEGEEDDLRAESERLSHAEELQTASWAAHDALVGPDDPGVDVASVAQLVSTASSALAPAAAHDPELDALRRRLDEIGYLASDLASDLSSYAAGVDVDAERLDAVHRRRADLTALLRRFGPTTRELLRFAREARDELSRLDLSADDVDELARRTESLRVQVGRLGAQLSSVREETARRVGREVGEELSHLAMGTAEVVVHVGRRPAAATGPDARAQSRETDEPTSSGDEPPGTVPLPDGRQAVPRRHGLDDVEIRLSANPGAPARSVARAASGGELSRVMLALEVVCGDDSLPTYVFDEVDAGVGGSAALDLGARLARLARTAQVVVVTHLGQVAAYADRHLVVRKSSDGQVTRSDVVVVDGADRESELARMLGGVADSRAATEHARELLARRGLEARA